jgi:hypothetical protein
MMRAKFPKKRPDGSFCVEVTLIVNTNDPKELVNRVHLWLEQWVQANREWRTSLAASAGGLLSFFDEFSGPPTCFLKGPNALGLRVEGRPNMGRWWRDWLILRILKDLQGEFSEVIQVESFADCPDSAL